MSDKIITHIALDTSFIESQNFLAGKLLYDLGDLGEKKYAHIYLTDIVYREVLSRFKTRVSEEDTKIRQVKKTINSNIRVLKNFDNYSSFFSLPMLDMDQVIREFKQKFDDWIAKANIYIIPTNDLTIGAIFKDYFENNPPFGMGEKKQEFPDAFSFLALQNHFSKNKLECLFVTKDKDFEEMGNGTIFPVNEVSHEIDKILRHEKQSEIFRLIQKVFDQERTALEKEARNLVLAFMEKEVEATGEFNGMWIDSLQKIDLSDVDFDGYQTVSLKEEHARMEVSGNFAYELTITVEDNSEAQYDREDGLYYGTLYRSITLKDSKDVKFSAYVNFDMEEEFAEIEISDLNDGKGFKIFNHGDDY